MLGAKDFPSMDIFKETFDEMKTAKATSTLQADRPSL
jgi:hypothetical protein